VPRCGPKPASYTYGLLPKAIPFFANTMSNLPACPQCTLENTYPDGNNYVCPDCGFEWPMAAAGEAATDGPREVKDSNGNVLATGDTVILIKDLKVKGSSIVLKKGTKIKGIRLPEGAGDHEVDCKTDQGAFMLKAEFMKKA
jgi:protein PhnA